MKKKTEKNLIIIALIALILGVVIGLLITNAITTGNAKKIFLAEEEIDEDTLLPCRSSGAGTAEDPKIICTPQQLFDINNNLDWHYILGEDIDLDHTTLSNDPTATWYDDVAGWPLISIFTGSLNGNGYKISNLYINRPNTNYVGLFRIINNHATIENIKLENINIIGNYRVGGLTAASDSGSSITNTYSTGNVSGNSSVGGLVGTAFSSSINNSHSTANVSGDYMIGGLIGDAAFSSSITNSYSTGNVSGRSNIGGLLGAFGSDCLVNNNYSTGNVSGNGFAIGGLVGVGGNILNSYSTGDINVFEGASSVGGLVGYKAGNITNCYSNGHIYVSGIIPNIGGLIGRTENGTTTSSYWDIQTSGQTTSAGGTGKTTTEMQTQSTFTDWDFSSTWAIDSVDGTSYPYLQENEQIPHPKPTVPAPIIIYTTTDLNNIRNNLTAYYILGQDIDLDVPPYNTDSGWEPIGTIENPFSGTLEGNGYKIKNLYINRPDTGNVGLFGSTSDATINNLGLENVNVTGNYSVGGFAGDIFGTISNSYSTGSVTGTDAVGGFAGNIYGTISNSHYTGSVTGTNSVGGFAGNVFGTISNSYSTGSVTGDYSIGGFTGGVSGSGTISNSYSTGSVTGNYSVGGFAGGVFSQYFNTISNCYSTGSVTGTETAGGFIGNVYYSTISNSYWDIQTSGQTTSAGGTGKTTAQMKTQSTFTDWDFSNIWNMNSSINSGYPYLRNNNQNSEPEPEPHPITGGPVDKEAEIELP